MKSFLRNLTLTCFIGLTSIGCAQESERYTFKQGDPYGIGKWYMGREIAHVMGHQGLDWLERPEREQEEKVSRLLRNLDIQLSDTIADIGAGSGYHSVRMAKEAAEGHVFAVDIQDEMLEEIRLKTEKENIENLSAVKGSETSIALEENSLDKVLLVDVYHEFNFPWEMTASIFNALKADGKVYLVEYRKEDSWVPIKTIHKMSESQAVKEMKAAGFILERNIGNLPWQHCMVFVKP